MFVEASEAQAQSLGFDPGVVYVPHPIQDRTDDEMRALADAALDKIVAALTTAGAPPSGHAPAPLGGGARADQGRR